MTDDRGTYDIVQTAREWAENAGEIWDDLSASDKLVWIRKVRETPSASIPRDDRDTRTPGVEIRAMAGAPVRWVQVDRGWYESADGIWEIHASHRGHSVTPYEYRVEGRFNRVRVESDGFVWRQRESVDATFPTVSSAKAWVEQFDRSNIEPLTNRAL